MAILIYSPISSVEGLLFSLSCPVFVVFDNCHSNGSKIVIHYSFDLYFPDSILHFFVICISSFQKCLFRSLAHIKIDYLQKIISVIEDTPFQFIGPFYIKVIISTVLIVLSGKLALILAFKER
jgi:hypothetical protein